MPSAGSEITVTLDERGRIAEDLSCVRCRYNLRTLEPSESCPECGEGIPRSYVGLWLLRQRRSVKQTLLLTYILFISTFCVEGIQIIFEIIVRSRLSPWAGYIMGVVVYQSELILLSVCGFLLVRIIGKVGLISAPLKRAALTAWVITPVLGISGSAAMLVYWSFGWLPVNMLGQSTRDHIFNAIENLGGLVAEAAFVVAMVCTAIGIRALLTRIPTDWLSRLVFALIVLFVAMRAALSIALGTIYLSQFARSLSGEFNDFLSKFPIFWVVTYSIWPSFVVRFLLVAVIGAKWWALRPLLHGGAKDRHEAA